MSNQYGLGLVPSPVDPRDYHVAEIVDLAAPLPAWYQSWKVGQGPKVLNQGKLPQCVAYSNAGDANWQERRDEGIANHEFDTDWFYRQCKAIDGYPGDGTYIRVALKVRKDKGYKSVGKNDAARHKVASYYAVPLDVNAIKSSIYQSGPVLIGSTWYKSWFNLDKQGRLPKPDAPVGGHAVFLWGWDDKRNAFYGRNSWGTTWGLVGNFMYPYEYIKHIHDAWRSTDVKNGPHR